MGSRLNNDSDVWNAAPSARIFTKEELAELRECFVLFDTTGSGFIKGDDLGRALRALGQNPSDEDVKKMLSDASLDGGRLGASEYLRVIGSCGLKKEGEMRDELTEAFRVFDRNDVGLVNAAELKHALKTYSEKFDDEDIERILQLAGVKDNGSIDYTEFTSKLVAK